MNSESENFMRRLATSDGVRFGTNVPFHLGRFLVSKIGFADIPVVGMVVTCRPQDRSALTPIVRAFVYAELEGAGIPNEAVAFTPSLGQTERGSRQVLFTDTNESSPTKGKRKKGQEFEWHFEIKKEFVNRFEWPRYGNPRAGKLPEASHGKEETETGPA